MKRVFTTSFQAGGVEATVSSSFNLDDAERREKTRAYIHLCKDLEAAGLLKTTEREISGDYTRQQLVLLFP